MWNDEKQQPTLSFFSFDSLMQLTCNNIFRAKPPRSPKISQNISQKLLDTAQIRVYTVAKRRRILLRRKTLRHKIKYNSKNPKKLLDTDEISASKNIPKNYYTWAK